MSTYLYPAPPAPRKEVTSCRWMSVVITEYDDPRPAPKFPTGGRIAYRSDIPYAKRGRDLAQSVITISATVFGVDPVGILLRTQEQRYADPRHVAMFVYRRLTNASYPEIGRVFGRHHTTCLAAIQDVEDRSQIEPAFALQVAEVQALLTSGVAR